MASKKIDARPSQLSEEYVQDSSDESEKSAEDESTGREPPKATATDDSAEEIISNGVALASEQQDAPASESRQSGQESSSSDNDGNKSDGEHSNVSSGSKKRSREPEKVTETTSSSKKQKKRYVKADPSRSCSHSSAQERENASTDTKQTIHSTIRIRSRHPRCFRVRLRGGGYLHRCIQQASLAHLSPCYRQSQLDQGVRHCDSVERRSNHHTERR